ncbi:type IV pilus assembly protein PilX [Litorivivens lipolytica]|uniref:Type IV pilus assembly protein PilX n=1 Tax=Litorivivens lipolytica TaxID=1524264 RepID=A0A7W4W742_9GAMM|nr:PilX N-terminal domain-containing pilus assembly protein [Litorivivens lipolytica]MBB3048716.1 type IV pilus assembly protein PilX [Litorivivens lipolytica]
MFIHKQRGAVLIVCLIFLLIMTVISASALQSTTLQERMAGNTRDTNSAFQAAEAALREAEAVLSSASLAAFNGSNGLYQDCSGTAAACAAPDWSDRNSTTWASVNQFGGGVNRDPQYIIEELTVQGSPAVSLDADTAVMPYKVYRITARGFGVSSNAMVVLRSIYRRQ